MTAGTTQRIGAQPLYVERATLTNGVVLYQYVDEVSKPGEVIRGKWTGDFMQAYRELDEAAHRAGWAFCGMCDVPFQGDGHLCASCSRLSF